MWLSNEIKKQILRKELKREIIGNREFIEVEYYCSERDFLTNVELEELEDEYSEDEDAFTNWLFTSYDGDLHSIELGLCAEALDNYFDDGENEEDNNYRWKVFWDIRNKITEGDNWSEFTLYI